MNQASDDAAWSWRRLADAVPPPILRRALDLLALGRVEIRSSDAGASGRVGPFEVGASLTTGIGQCSCQKPQPCAHVAALLAASADLDPWRAPAHVRDAARTAFAATDPPVPVPAFPETATDLEVPAEGLSDGQRAAVEAIPGVVRKAAAAYTVPRAEALALTATLDALATGLIVYARRPYVRLRASLKREEPVARLVAQETPGMGIRAALERAGYRAIRRPKSLVHEFEGPSDALHLLAEGLGELGTAVVLAEGPPPVFEALAPPPSAKARATQMPVVFSRRRFEWWTPRWGLQPLQLAILQRHGVAAGNDVRLTTDGLKAVERELHAAGLHAARVEDAAPILAVASPTIDGAAHIEIKGAPFPSAVTRALRDMGYHSTGSAVSFDGPASRLPDLVLALAQTGVHVIAGPAGWPSVPERAAEPPSPLLADDPRVPLAREGVLVVLDGDVAIEPSPKNGVLPRSLRVELYRRGWLSQNARAVAPIAEAGRMMALLRDMGFEAKWPRPTANDWRLASVRYNERPRREGGGTLVHLKGPIPLGRLGGVDPGEEAARIGAIVRGMEETLRERHPDARPVAHGALPGVWAVPGGAGAFLIDAARRGATVTASATLNPIPLGRGVVLVDQACLPPRLMEFRRTVGEDGVLRPVVSPEIENVIRRVVAEGLEVDEERGHYLIPSTKMNELVDALRELGAKVLQRRLAPRGSRYARWEPKLPEDETGARPRLREPFRPAPFEGEIPGLRPETKLDQHQKEGVAFILHNAYCCLLADEMGLGKTLTAISAAQFLQGRVLVVCPASARAVWKQEVHAWTTESSRVLQPGNAPDDVKDLDQGEKYVIVAYSGLQKFADALRTIPFDLVVLDESHYVKSRQAQRTRLVEEKLRSIPRRLILSGTPVMNAPKEIRTQLAFVHPDEWSDTAWFNRRFQTPWKEGTPDVKQAVLARLRQYLEGIMLRREKRQALPDLPEKHLRVHRLALPPESRRAYDEQEDGFRDYMHDHEEDALTSGMATTAGGLERLKQTALVGKLPFVLSSVRKFLDDGEKVVVFCHYREPINAIAKDLAPYGVVTLTGSTRPDERGEVVKLFQQRDDVRVFVGQTVAAGVAITLTAARHAVFTDLEWNPALHRQAMDRIHRKTQTRDVEVHFFLAEDTVEEDIAEVLEEKAQMMEQLLEGRAGGFFGARDEQAAQREVALRILSRRRRLMATEGEDED